MQSGWSVHQLTISAIADAETLFVCRRLSTHAPKAHAIGSSNLNDPTRSRSEGMGAKEWETASPFTDRASRATGKSASPSAAAMAAACGHGALVSPRKILVSK